MPILIERNNPIQPVQHPKYKGYTAALRRLLPGDSAFFPNKTVKDLTAIRNRLDKILRRKTISRTVEGGVRIWRII